MLAPIVKTEHITPTLLNKTPPGLKTPKISTFSTPHPNPIPRPQIPTKPSPQHPHNNWNPHKQHSIPNNHNDPPQISNLILTKNSCIYFLLLRNFVIRLGLKGKMRWGNLNRGVGLKRLWLLGRGLLGILSVSQFKGRGLAMKLVMLKYGSRRLRDLVHKRDPC